MGIRHEMRDREETYDNNDIFEGETRLFAITDECRNCGY